MRGMRNDASGRAAQDWPAGHSRMAGEQITQAFDEIDARRAAAGWREPDVEIAVREKLTAATNPITAAQLISGLRAKVRDQTLHEAANSVRTVAAQLGFPLDIVNMLCEDLDGVDMNNQASAPQCWHLEPGTPCDWDVCRQAERLAVGDVGDPNPSTPNLDRLRANRPLGPDRGEGLT